MRALGDGVKRGERRAIAKAITLVESSLERDRELAEELLVELYPASGRALRLGVSGVPGAGKSTLIDALGSQALSAGRRVGVLSVDPSSRVSGGSVLGDRTRMARLGQAAQAFVRPSPSAGASGGVAPRTREALIVLEAAGYDFVIVETVGTGQAELGVTELSDIVLLVLLAGAGDDVQTLKRGILEYADIVAFNKADGANATQTLAACDQMSAAFSWLRKDSPRAFAVSALEAVGIAELYAAILERFEAERASGAIEQQRAAQRLAWLEQALLSALLARLPSDSAPTVELRAAVGRGELLPLRAARELVKGVAR
ncbi:MAG: methylmalonyl Co-A mutase-associated GTPase MeaB [Polyangiaceae bacterium]